jgi:hypothetical protein
MGLLLRFTLRHGLAPCLGHEWSMADAKCDNGQIQAVFTEI